MPSVMSAVDTTTSAAAVAPVPLAEAVAVERMTVPLGGGLVASTSAENDTVALCPAAMRTG